MKVNTTQAQQKSELKSGIGYPGMLLTIDMFGEPLPNFNIKGKSEVRTHCGGCLSMVLIFTVIMFATLKFQHLLMKHNPTLNVFEDRDALDVTDIW